MCFSDKEYVCSAVQLSFSLDLFLIEQQNFHLVCQDGGMGHFLEEPIFFGIHQKQTYGVTDLQCSVPTNQGEGVW